jgi:hypothetical protein
MHNTNVSVYICKKVNVCRCNFIEQHHLLELEDKLELLLEVEHVCLLLGMTCLP